MEAIASSLAGSGEVVFVKIAIEANTRVRVRSRFERVLSARALETLERECHKKKRRASSVVSKRRTGLLRPPRLAGSVLRAFASQRAAAPHAPGASAPVLGALPRASGFATRSSGAQRL